MRACAVSYGAPTLFHVSRAARRAVAAPAQSCSASRIRPSRELHRPFENRRSAAVDQVAVGDRLELVRRSRGRAGSHRRRARSRSAAGRRRERLSGSSCLVRERPPDRRRGGVHLPLREPQERESRLRLAAELVGLAVGLLRGGEVTPPPPDLADLVETGRGHHAVVVVELLARLHRLLLRLRPVARAGAGSRPVDAARAREAGDVEAVAPAVGGVGPLRRSAAVAERLARVDRDAVDDPGGERIELSARRGRRRLVEDGEPVRHVPRPDADRTLEDEGRRLEAAVAEARSPARARGGRPRLRTVRARRDRAG